MIYGMKTEASVGNIITILLRSLKWTSVNLHIEIRVELQLISQER
jgi:hypothetical protein